MGRSHSDHVSPSLSSLHWIPPRKSALILLQTGSAIYWCKKYLSLSRSAIHGGLRTQSQHKITASMWWWWTVFGVIFRLTCWETRWKKNHTYRKVMMCTVKHAVWNDTLQPALLWSSCFKTGPIFMSHFCTEHYNLLSQPASFTAQH